MKAGSGGLALERDHAFNDAHHIRFLHDDEVLAVDLDLCAGPLPEQDPIASLHIERYELAALIASPRPGGDDLPFLRLLLLCIRRTKTPPFVFSSVLTRRTTSRGRARDGISWVFPLHALSASTTSTWHSYCKSAKKKKQNALLLELQFRAHLIARAVG